MMRSLDHYTILDLLSYRKCSLPWSKMPRNKDDVELGGMDLPNTGAP